MTRTECPCVTFHEASQSVPRPCSGRDQSCFNAHVLLQSLRPTIRHFSTQCGSSAESDTIIPSLEPQNTTQCGTEFPQKAAATLS